MPKYELYMYERWKGLLEDFFWNTVNIKKSISTVSDKGVGHKIFDLYTYLSWVEPIRAPDKQV